MFENNLPIDMMTVADFIMRRKGIKELFGHNVPYAISRKTLSVVSSAHLEYHGLCIKEMWLEREVMKITMGGVDPSNDGLTQLKDVQDRLRELTTHTVVSDWQDMSQLLVDLSKHQDDMLKTKGMGLITGFKTIDQNYGGFHPGQMIVIAARPSVGKSAFGGQIAINLARSGAGVGIVSLEMNNNEIAARIAAIDTDMDFTTIYRNLYADENERQKFYQKVSSSTSSLPIFVTDRTDVNVMDIKAKAYKLRQKQNISCLIVDYLQLVGADSSNNRSRENEVAKISRGFKIIAKELQVPLVVLAQLNREVEKRKGKERFPQLSDLRESGAIEQDADVVMFLHSDYKSGIIEDEQGSTENRAHLVIRKWRNGQANIIVDLDFNGPQMKFTESNHTQFGNFRPVDTNYNDANPF